jgi:hypothetical protein
MEQVMFDENSDMIDNENDGDDREIDDENSGIRGIICVHQVPRI